MRILIKGAGDLATGIAYELWLAGHEVLMTEIAIPLAVRRMVRLIWINLHCLQMKKIWQTARIRDLQFWIKKK